jgi:hypothetical protein
LASTFALPSPTSMSSLRQAPWRPSGEPGRGRGRRPTRRSVPGSW